MVYYAEATDTKGIEFCCSRTQLPQPLPRLRRQLGYFLSELPLPRSWGGSQDATPVPALLLCPVGKGQTPAQKGRWLFHAFLAPSLTTAKILVIKPQHGVRMPLRESKSYSQLCH